MSSAIKLGVSVVFILSLLFAFSIVSAQKFSGPTAPPPNNNVNLQCPDGEALQRLGGAVECVSLADIQFSGSCEHGIKSFEFNSAINGGAGGYIGECVQPSTSVVAQTPPVCSGNQYSVFTNTGWQCRNLPAAAPPAPVAPTPPPVVQTRTERSCGQFGTYFANQDLCRIRASSCPAGWHKLRNWSTTSSRKCESVSSNGFCSDSCTTMKHSFSDNPVESCRYDRLTSTGPAMFTFGIGGATVNPNCQKQPNLLTCSANIREIGCRKI